MAFDVLLLDGDGDVIAAVTEILRGEGLSIRAVRTGVEAFAAVMESRPDAVIAAVGLHGDETRKLYQVMQHLTNLRTVPFLFLEKPFGKSDLREKVDRLREATGEGVPEMSEGPTGLATCSIREVLVDTIEFLVGAGRTGTLTVTAVGDEGSLSVEKGVLRHASFGTLRGEEALMRLLGLEGVEVNYGEGGREALVPNLDIDWKTFAATHC